MYLWPAQNGRLPLAEQWADYKDAVNTVSVHSQYFTCADAVARKYAHPSQKVVYYLITDSHKLEREALRRFGDRIVVTGLKQAHVEIKTDRSKGLSAIKLAADGFMRTIAESWIFAGTFSLCALLCAARGSSRTAFAL